MSGRGWVPEAWLRHHARRLGIPEDEVIAYVRGGTWIRGHWDRLAADLASDTPGIERIRSTRLLVSMTLGANAMTDSGWDDGYPIVRVEFGFAAWLRELARIMTPFFVAPEGPGPLRVAGGQVEWATPGLSIDSVVDRLTYSLSWLTSCAGHPNERASDDDGLTPPQVAHAGWMADGGLLFAIAHEMGHVAAGDLDVEPDPETSRSRELAADRWALRRVQALAERDPAWPLDVVLLSVAVVLWAKTAAWAYAGVESQPEAREPAPLERMQALDAEIRALGQTAGGLWWAAVAQAFGLLLGELKAAAPDSLAPRDELRRLLEGIVPAEVLAVLRPGLEPSWRLCYATAVEGYLLVQTGVPDDEPVDVATIEPVLRWYETYPGLVMDTLRAARLGRTAIELDEPTARAVAERAREVALLLPNEYATDAVLRPA